jgi:multiple sugar transport system permease protein
VTAASRISHRLDRLGEGPFAAVVAAPGLLLVLLIIAPPVLAAIAFSLFRIELGSPGTEPFIALRNYVVRLPADAEFLGTIPVTLAFGAIVTAVAVPVALGAALLVHGRTGRAAGLLALLLILPWAVAPIGDGLLWRLLVDPSEGILGKLLRYAHLPPLRLQTAEGAMLTLLVAVTWRAMPLLGVLFLGALRQVPPELLRAARMDGASGWQAFRRVTLPIIAPAVAAATLVELILTIQAFDIQFALTSDQPPKGTELTAMHIFHSIMETISLGYGATQTVVLALFIGVGVWILWLVVRRRTDSAAGALVAEPVESDEPAVRRPTVLPRTWERERMRRRFPLARDRAGRLARFAGAALLTVWVVGPLLWILIGSLQPDYAIGNDPPKFVLPPQISIYQAFLGSDIWQGAAIVSIFVATTATVAALAIAALAAYPLARYRLRGGRALLMALLGSQLIPPIALAIPILYIFIRLDLRNTIPGLVLVNTAFWTPVLVWLLRAAFLAVPRNLDLAARIDGSSRLGVVFRIVIPAAAPAIAASTAVVFIGIWNDFVFIATIGGRDTRTLASFLGESASPSFHVLSTKLMLTILPCVAMIVVLRRRILRLV